VFFKEYATQKLFFIEMIFEIPHFLNGGFLVAPKANNQIFVTNENSVYQ
jgi:hypothetical protein